MRTYKVIGLVILTVVLISPKTYCQQAMGDQQVQAIVGTVTSVDVAGSVLTIQTDTGRMMLYFTAESDLYRFTHHISYLEINNGDPVIVQYLSTPSGKSMVVKLVDNKVNKED